MQYFLQTSANNLTKQNSIKRVFNRSNHDTCNMLASARNSSFSNVEISIIAPVLAPPPSSHSRIESRFHCEISIQIWGKEKPRHIVKRRIATRTSFDIKGETRCTVSKGANGNNNDGHEGCSSSIHRLYSSSYNSLDVEKAE